MIHQLIFAAPRPGMSEQEFQRYWVQEHAVRYASRIPQIKRYCVDTRIPLPEEHGEPRWGGIAEIWLENEEDQLASLQSPEFLQGARLDEPRWAAFWRTVVLDTDSHVVLAGAPWDADSPGTKLVILAKRREGTTLAAFRRYSMNEHAKQALAVPGLRRYHQNFTRDAAYGVGEALLDVAYQMWFDDVDALHAAMAGPQYQAVLRDLYTFTEARYVHTMAVRENWIIGPASR